MNGCVDLLILDSTHNPCHTYFVTLASGFHVAHYFSTPLSMFLNHSSSATMPPITNQLINTRVDKDCEGITPERKYYHTGSSWVKRTLRPSEWQIDPFKGTCKVPRFAKERAFNEAACMQFIAEHTKIPVPKLHCCFEDDGAVILVMEYIDGIGMNELAEQERKVVEVELEAHVRAMRMLTSKIWGGPSGLVRSHSQAK